MARSRGRLSATRICGGASAVAGIVSASVVTPAPNEIGPVMASVARFHIHACPAAVAATAWRPSGLVARCVSAASAPSTAGSGCPSRSQRRSSRAPGTSAAIPRSPGSATRAAAPPGSSPGVTSMTRSTAGVQTRIAGSAPAASTAPGPIATVTIPAVAANRSTCRPVAGSQVTTAPSSDAVVTIAAGLATSKATLRTAARARSVRTGG